MLAASPVLSNILHLEPLQKQTPGTSTGFFGTWRIPLILCWVLLLLSLLKFLFNQALSVFLRLIQTV